MWNKYVPVHSRHAKAKKLMNSFRKLKKEIQPVIIEGRTIAKEFWGKQWCKHLEYFADYDNRLPRGRTYIRNGSVCHLNIRKGGVDAYVYGSYLYSIDIAFTPLSNTKWERIKKECRGQIESLVELLKGEVSSSIMEIVADEKKGLFPKTTEMECNCDCPDSAKICKHIAAVLYGIGNRLDTEPKLLFSLRSVSPEELIQGSLNIASDAKESQIATTELSDIFGIDLEPVEKPKKKAQPLLPTKGLTGKRLKQFRKKLGMNQATFSSSLGITPNQLAEWEKKESIPLF